MASSNPNSTYYDRILEWCYNASSLQHDQPNDNSNGTGPSSKTKLILTVVVMFLMGSILCIDGFLRLFAPRFTLTLRLFLGRYNLEPTSRFLLHFAFVQFFPLLLSEFSSEHRDYIPRLLILLWMLLVELIRKKVQVIMLPTDGSSFKRGIGRFSLMDYSDEASRLVLIGFFLYASLDLLQQPLLTGVFVALWLLGLLKLVQRAVNTWMASGSWHTARNPLLIAGYMQHLMEEEAGGAVDMSKCRFAVMGEEKLAEGNKEERQRKGWAALKLAAVGRYGDGVGSSDQSEQKRVHLLLNPNKLKAAEQEGSLVTVGKIWELHREKPDLFPAKTWQRLEDLCLSLSLFKMLRRRFEHYPMVEVGSVWARRVMLQGLLGLEGGGEDDDRPFQVLGLELEILSHYYQQVAAPVVMSQHVLFLCNSASSAVFLALSLAAAFIIIFPMSLTLNPRLCLLYCSKTLVFREYLISLSITLLLLLTVNALETYEFWTLYVFSNWNMVRMLCSYSSLGSPLRRRLYAAVIKVRFCAHSWLPAWFTSGTGVNVQQVSIIDACGALDKYSTRATPRRLPKTARSCIIQSLKGVDPETGFLGLPRLQGLDLHYGADDGKLQTTSTEIVLACHLATELLEMTEHHHMTPDRVVASALSKYCMYLVAHVPQLLPDDEMWVSNRYEDMRSCMALVSRHYCGMFCAPSPECRKANAVRVLQEEEESLHEPTTRRGLRLFRELEKRAAAGGDPAAVWKDLADFWVSLLIYLAPSNDVQGHARALATWGSDLITCLWAFCTHAGITRHPHQLVSDDCQEIVLV